MCCFVLPFPLIIFKLLRTGTKSSFVHHYILSTQCVVLGPQSILNAYLLNDKTLGKDSEINEIGYENLAEQAITPKRSNPNPPS